jgi:hypothetical protein
MSVLSTLVAFFLGFGATTRVSYVAHMHAGSNVNAPFWFSDM